MTSLFPAIFNSNLFDLFDAMNDTFTRAGDAKTQVPANSYAHMLKTDVQENDNGYVMNIDMPGMDKENISLTLENGYLTVEANKTEDRKENDQEGKWVRRERFTGVMRRSYYVGDQLTQEDVKASYKDGVLRLEVPKKDTPRVQEAKHIMITD